MKASTDLGEVINVQVTVFRSEITPRHPEERRSRQVDRVILKVEGKVCTVLNEKSSKKWF